MAIQIASLHLDGIAGFQHPNTWLKTVLVKEEATKETLWQQGINVDRMKTGERKIKRVVIEQLKQGCTSSLNTEELFEAQMVP